MKTPETMESRLLKLLQRSKKPVTPLEALDKAGCLSLSQRCGSFARRGHNLLKEWVDLPNRKRVMGYRIID